MNNEELYVLCFDTFILTMIALAIVNMVLLG